MAQLNRTRSRALTTVGSAAIAALALMAGGCGSTPTAVDAATVLAPQLGSIGITVDPGTLRCDSPDELTAGTSVSCSYERNGQPVGLVAKVSSVAGTKISFDVTTQPKDVSADDLAQAVASRVSTELGVTITSASCTDGLAAEVKQATTCTLSNGSETKTVKITVSGLVGGQIDYTIEAA